MCGRFSLYVAPELLEERYDAHFEEYVKYESYNIAPSQMTPVITNDDPKLIQMVKWGIKPKWFKPKGGLINLRSETVRDKPMFRKLFENNRCLIPTTGFYEWKKGDDGKIPYHIKLKDEKIFSLAGVWADSEDEKGNKTKTFSIITTEPNSLMKKIHNRMPVIISEDKEIDWLKLEANKVVDLLNPYNPKDMEAYPISSKINSPKNDFAELIRPI